MTRVPPVVGPETGLIERTVGVGGGLKYMNRASSVGCEVPRGVVTVTWTVPGTPAGVTAVISPSDTTVTSVAVAVPNLTRVAPLSRVPWIVTRVPPTTGPDAG